MRKYIASLLLVLAVAAVAWSKDQRAPDPLCSGNWLVIQKSGRLDPETDNKSWLYTVVFRKIVFDDADQVQDERLEVGQWHTLFWRWADLFMGNEVGFKCSDEALYDGPGFKENLGRAYFVVPIRHKYER